MLVPLKELYRHATLEWNTTEKCIRLLKWSEALAAVCVANLLTTYITSGSIEPPLERDLRAIGTPTFGMYVSILRISLVLKDKLNRSDFSRFIASEYASADYPGLDAASAHLRHQFGLNMSWHEPCNTVHLFELLLGVRNKGIGHGGIPQQKESEEIEQVCKALAAKCDQLAKVRALVVNEIRADTERSGDFLLRGLLYDDESESLWEERRGSEDLLSLKQLHFLRPDGRPVAAPPFVQMEGRSFWFLQKYRRTGKSPFSDFRSPQPRTDSYWDDYLEEFFERRIEEPGIPLQMSSTGVCHDLPPESEAYTKFIGRLKNLEDLTSQLRPERRTHIVALGGVGGVGKTALARAFAKSIVEAEDENRSFDYIVWVSAKRTVLKESVESLQPGFEDIEDVLDEIARVADSPQLIYQRPFEAKKAQILDLLAGARFLLVIDNFETVKRKEKFWEFLLEIPAPSKVLVTSRETFSEGCLTLQVVELGEQEALDVFSAECGALGDNPEHLLKNKKDKTELVLRTGGVPLALKHIAILLHRGTPFSEALQRLSAKVGPIAEFCFRETFKSLGKNEKMIWVAFGVFQRPVTVGELVQVAELDEHEIGRILGTLTKYSIAARSIDNEGFESFSCLPLTLEFAKKEAETWTGASEMSHRYRQYRAVISRAGIADGNSEAAQVARTAKVVHPKLLARELSRRAIAVYREGRTPEALELLDMAQRIDARQPAVWEARAQIHLGEFDYHAAYHSYVQLLDISPLNLNVLRQLVYISKVLEEWGLEIEYGRRLVQLPGASAKDWHILGMAYYKKAKVEKDSGRNDAKQAALLNAVEAFRSGLISNPRSNQEKNQNKYACHSLALTYIHLKRFDEAEEILLKGLEWVPYDASLLELQNTLMSRQRMRPG
jgi:tetratricopeptide (TPR) repeat protein